MGMAPLQPEFKKYTLHEIVLRVSFVLLVLSLLEGIDVIGIYCLVLIAVNLIGYLGSSQNFSMVCSHQSIVIFSKILLLIANIFSSNVTQIRMGKKVHNPQTMHGRLGKCRHGMIKQSKAFTFNKMPMNCRGGFWRNQ